MYNTETTEKQRMSNWQSEKKELQNILSILDWFDIVSVVSSSISPLKKKKAKWFQDASEPQRKPHVHVGESDLLGQQPELLLWGTLWKYSFDNKQVLWVLSTGHSTASLWDKLIEEERLALLPFSSSFYQFILPLMKAERAFFKHWKDLIQTAWFSVLSVSSLYQNDSGVDISLEQWFSNRVSLTPTGHLAMCQNISGCDNCYWRVVGGAQGSPPVTL